METKLNFKEIVPANDILEDEMEFVKGGTDFNLCFKGCVTGDKSDKTKGSTTTQPTTQPTTSTTQPTTSTTHSTTSTTLSTTSKTLGK